MEIKKDNAITRVILEDEEILFIEEIKEEYKIFSKIKFNNQNETNKYRRAKPLQNEILQN